MQKNALCGRLASYILSDSRSDRYITKTLLVMKLTFVLLTMALLNVNANGISQTITFSGHNVDLKKIFSEVERQTGYSVFYTDNMLAGAKPVSLEVNNVTLDEFFQKILAGQPLKYSIDSKTILLSRKEGLVTDLKSTDGALAPLGSIQGRVTNEEGEPLVGANVTVKETNAGTVTDNRGYYKIENIAATENYTLVISYVGYKTQMTAIKISANGNTALDIKLTPSLVNLDQVTVAGTLSARKIRAYPATIAVIKQEDLKNRNLNNIADVLEAVPGVIVTPGSEFDNSANARQPFNLLIRGTSAGAPIKYLIDGIEIVAEGRSLSFLQTLDPNDIEKIEILKGPMASTLYGNGAAGGIISITTKKGKAGKTKINFKTMFTQYANEYADYSGYNKNYSLNVSGGDEQFNYLLGSSYNLYPTTKLTDVNNGIDQKTWSYTAKVRGKIKNIAADLSLQYGSENSGNGSIDISTNKYRVALGLSPYTVYPLEDYRYSQRNFLTSLHLTHTITKNWYQDLTVGYNLMNYGYADYTVGNYYNSEYLFSKMNVRYFTCYDHSWSPVLKTSITGGFEYNGYETHLLGMSLTEPLTNFFTGYTPAVESAAYYRKSPYSSMGYFAEAVTGLKNNLFLTTGIRYDFNAAYGDNIGAYAQPRVGLSYVIESADFKIKPRIVWGVSSTPPDPTYKITTVTTYPWATYVTTGNPDIKPQRSEGYEFGADLFYGNNYSLNITYYDQQIKDMIQSSFIDDLTTNPITYTTYNYNIANAINRGLEISAKAVIDPFVIDISYTQTSSKWGKETGQLSGNDPTIYPHAPNLGIPERSAFARLTYNIPSFLSWSKKGGRISLDWKYNGSSYDYDLISYYLAASAWQNTPDPKPAYPDLDKYLIWQKGYFHFNLRADYSVTNYAALYLDIQNLLDKQGSVNGQNINRFPGRRINFGFNLNF